MDHRIWFRNYQIVQEDGSLAEIGPRFTLNLIKIFDGSFGGPVLFSNTHYITPSKHRRIVKQAAENKYKERVLAKKGKEIRNPKGDSYKDVDPYDDIFNTSK